MTDFHKPGIIQPGKLGLTRGACFAASRLELAAVAVLLWFWWCVLSAALFSYFSPPNRHGLYYIRHVSGSLAPFTSQDEAVFFTYGKQASS